MSIIGREARLLSKQLDKEASGFLLRVAENMGLHIALLGDLAALEDGRAYLENGRAFEAATVIFATGIRSNVKMGQSAGLTLGRGIVVDRQMQTSQPGIWAAGDCAELEGQVAGLWTVAMAQGAVAGANAAGAQQVYEAGLPHYSMGAMGMELLSYGELQAESTFSQVNGHRPAFGKMFFREGRLSAVEAIGAGLPLFQLQKAVDQQLPREEAVALLKQALA